PAVEELKVRLLPDRDDDGSTQMAADDVMLQAARRGIASLRFYTWSHPTLSLGYFQREAHRHSDPLLSELCFVRRPTGGHALVHHHEQTYALAVPVQAVWKRGPCWLRMHEVIAAALAEFGVEVRRRELNRQDASMSYLCFHHFAPGDLMLGSAKIGGRARRRQHGGGLPHGADLRARSAVTPSLPGVRELTGIDLNPRDLRLTVAAQAEYQLGWRLLLEDWTAEEVAGIEGLAANRYRTDAWNRKR